MRGCILPKDSTGIRLQGGSWGGSWKPQYELLAVLLSPPQCLYSHTLNQLLHLLFGAPIPNPRDPQLEDSVVTAPGALSIPQAPVGLGSALEGSSGSSSGGSGLASTRTAQCCGLGKRQPWRGLSPQTLSQAPTSPRNSTHGDTGTGMTHPDTLGHHMCAWTYTRGCSRLVWAHTHTTHGAIHTPTALWVHAHLRAQMDP